MIIVIVRATTTIVPHNNYLYTILERVMQQGNISTLFPRHISSSMGNSTSIYEIRNRSLIMPKNPNNLFSISFNDDFHPSTINTRNSKRQQLLPPISNNGFYTLLFSL